MATPDEEQALLGILEASLGDRQRAMNGLHLDQGTSLEVHREMLELTHRTAEHAPAPDVEQDPGRADGRPTRQTSHRRPRAMTRWVQAARLRLAGQPRPDTDPGPDAIELRAQG
jgi:hypothetical protein